MGGLEATFANERYLPDGWRRVELVVSQTFSVGRSLAVLVMYGRCLLVVSLFALVALALPVGLPDAAAQTGQKKQRVAKAPDAVPANYRQLITRYFAAKGGIGANTLNARISRPGIWNAPIGPKAPIVCVKWTVPGTFGPHGMELIFRFNEGQIYDALNPETAKYGAGAFGVMLLKSVTCDKLVYGPYPEVVKRQRPKR